MNDFIHFIHTEADVVGDVEEINDVIAMGDDAVATGALSALERWSLQVTIETPAILNADLFPVSVGRGDKLLKCSNLYGGWCRLLLRDHDLDPSGDFTGDALTATDAAPAAADDGDVR